MVERGNNSKFKETYSKRLTSGILGYPHRKRITDLTQMCQSYCDKITLDIGCGDLYFDKGIIPLQKGFIGCDLGWEDSLKRAKTNIKEFNWNNVDILQSYGEHLPLKDKKFELILCFETLEHVHNEKKVIDEINRLSKEDTILVISAPIEFGLILLLKEIFRGLVSSRIYKGSHAKSVREDSYALKELLYAIIFRKTDGVSRVPHSHKGYDYRRTLELLEPNWNLIKKRNTPFSTFPDSLSYGCILVLRKK